MGLVSTQWLETHLEDADVRVCDVRWFLASTGRSGRAEYQARHLPGAVFVDLDADLAAPDDGREGRHPLPSADAFQAAMRRAGISESTHVIAYDDSGGTYAARLWWLLRAHGHAKVSLLDGGFGVWKAENRPLATGPVRVAEGGFTSRPVAGVSLDLPATRAFLKTGLLLDARAANRYQGEVEPIDPRPGHIPGATNLPTSDLLADGRFLSVERLRERFAKVGADQREVAASCGSGVTACHLLFAMDLAGVRPFPSAKLYVGSYSEWSRKAELPVATGAATGEPV